MEITASLRGKEAGHRALEEWKHQVEEMIHDVQSKVVPVMEGGMVKTLPMKGAEGSFISDAQASSLSKHGRPSADEWKAMEGKNGVKVHHHHHHHQQHGHRHGRSFGCR